MGIANALTCLEVVYDSKHQSNVEENVRHEYIWDSFGVVMCPTMFASCGVGPVTGCLKHALSFSIPVGSSALDCPVRSTEQNYAQSELRTLAMCRCHFEC